MSVKRNSTIDSSTIITITIILIVIVIVMSIVIVIVIAIAIAIVIVIMIIDQLCLAAPVIKDGKLERARN